MKAFYQVKYQLKQLRWQVRRGAAAGRWGREQLSAMPSVLGNAMPKSGSHLLIQVLEGLIELGPFVNPGFPPINRFEDNSHLTEAQMVTRLKRMSPGDIGYAYLPAREPYVSTVVKPGRANVFIYRDPRDLLVSHVFYATDMHTDHGMHNYYNQLDSMEARLNAAILGVNEPDASVPGIRRRYEDYMGWLTQSDVFSVRFEDVIQEKDRTLGRILDYLTGYGFEPEVSREQAVEVLKHAIEPKRSGTFRKGKAGGWREHFTSANIETIKAEAGDIIVKLGYEHDEDWT